MDRYVYTQGTKGGIMTYQPTMRHATLADMLDFIPRMRAADRDECQATLGVGPEAILPALAAAPHCYSLCDEHGVVQAVWGLGPHDDNPNLAMIWMTATPELNRHWRFFLKEVPKALASANKLFPLIYAYTDCRNTEHHKWLRFTGFKFIAKKERWGAEGRPFYLVIRTNDLCA